MQLVITYGMALIYKRHFTDKTHTNIEKIYVYASERSERA